MPSVIAPASILDAVTAFLPTILKTAALLAVCLIVIKILLAATSRILKKSKLDLSLHGIVCSTLRVLLLFLTILIVAPTLGIETSSLLAVLSIAGAAITLSIQGILGNFFSGVTLLASKPFKVGDYVTIGGMSGTVVETGITHTKLHTPDNQVILVPNSSVTSNVITNVTAHDTRRLDFTFTASYDDDPAAVIAALTEAVDIDLIQQDPAPFVALSKYADSSIEYVVRVWVRGASYWDANFLILDRVHKCYQKHGVSMTYPHINVHTLP